MLHDGVGWEGAAAPVGRARRERNGRNAVERKAVFRVQTDVASMPASLVVQLALWPDDVAHWARAAGEDESLVYNMLARRKPYWRAREALARRLQVSVAVLSHLIESERPLPTARRPLGADGLPSAGPFADLPSIDWGAPPFPLFRDGTNPVEGQAVRRVEQEVASMPASAVVGLALWPDTLASWAREQRVSQSLVTGTLAGSPSDPVRTQLARRLGVGRDDLEELIAGIRRTPAAVVPPMPPAPRAADAPPPPPGPSEIGPEGQLSLGF
jgi:hypothetical protein